MSMALKMLMVEDEEVFARAAARGLGKAGHSCYVAGTLAEARRCIARGIYDVVLLDIRLPDGSGLDLIEEVRSIEPDPPPVVVLSAYGEIEDAVTAMKQGAADYLRKPLDLDELLVVVERAAENAGLRRRLKHAQERESSAREDVVLLGESDTMQTVRDRIRQIVDIPAGEDGALPNVLITGETGTGKDIAARAIHAASAEDDRPFVRVDCTGLPADLMDAELFGHARGAFADARDARTGLIEAAEDGTVFLDEIGELPIDLQAKLLSVIERRTARRLGATRETPVRARFIAATNRNLEEMVAQGNFRRDLFYRLNVLSLELPPLRTHREDVPLYVDSFLHAIARRYGRPLSSFDDAAMRRLSEHDWPGNVRELKHLVQRAALLFTARTLSLRDLPLSPVAPVPDLPQDLDLEEVEKRHIVEALKRAQGNISRAADLLGLTRMALRYRMQKHDIGRPGEESGEQASPRTHG